MVKRWIFYLVVLMGCTVFYTFSPGLIAWVLLVTVGCAPWLSLVLSLAPMLLVAPTLGCPGGITVGSEEQLTLRIRSPLPLPPCRCRFRGQHTLTGEKLRLKPEDPLPTDHCGAVKLHCTGFFVYDYMGMFRLKGSRIPDRQLLIRPRPIHMDPPPELEQVLARSWKPKYGGGFAEHHELRLYRPGDGLNQVHWKLTAKTGKLIVREPMLPQPGRVLLTMDLAGTPDEMDRKLSRLQWMGHYLLDRGLPHTLQVHTGNGLRLWNVSTEMELVNAIDSLLAQTPAVGGSVLSRPVVASWQYHIGGDDFES